MESLKMLTTVIKSRVVSFGVNRNYFLGRQVCKGDVHQQLRVSSIGAVHEIYLVA